MELNTYLDVLSKLNKTNLSNPERFFAINNTIIENEILPSVPVTLTDATTPSSWKYTVNMYRILIDIKRLLDKSKIEQPSATFDIEHFAVSTRICCKFGLEPYLHKAMANNKCFSALYRDGDIQSTEECYGRLQLGINTLSELLLFGEFSEHEHYFDEVLLTCMAAIFSSTRNNSDPVHRILDQMYEAFPEKHFRTLLIVKSNPSLPSPLQIMLHRQLMKRLVCPSGFEVLCKTLIKTGDGHNNEPIWKLSSAVFDIVGRKSQQKEFYVAIIRGIFRFFTKCIQSTELEQYSDACVGSLSRLYGLKIREVSDLMVQLLVGRLDTLNIPEEIFAGCIVLDSQQFAEVISMNFLCFCSSVHVALPTEILVPYLRILCQLFSQIEVAHLRSKISTLIVHCLHNRESTELKSIINSLLFTDHDNYLKSMHPRIVIQSSNTCNDHKCVVTTATDSTFFDASECVINILKSSSNHLLTYNVFVHLFEQLSGGSTNNASQSKSDLIQNEDELNHLMSQVFRKRIAVYYTLSELINHRPLHYQIGENPSEILNICIKIIRNHLSDPQCRTLNGDHSTVLVLSIIKEFLEKIKFTQKFDEFIEILVQLKDQSKSNEIGHQINSILVDINHTTTPFEQCERSPFVMAKEMCEELEPHLKVYGLMQFIKLIRVDKDVETLKNKHALLAISLMCLKDDDSYVFLNCIKLLIVLCDVLESVVLEMLIAEYQSMDNGIDHRLKIGEVIVKVVEGLGVRLYLDKLRDSFQNVHTEIGRIFRSLEDASVFVKYVLKRIPHCLEVCGVCTIARRQCLLTGPMSYNYKNSLINCFLRESTSNVNEIRLSSLSNLSSICRILSYQIPNFFQEMMVILKSVIQNDDYLPARRSAVLALTDIIHGVENLIDFQEILLPVYQTLRDVAINESDQCIRVHAERGLQRLNSKIKDFLSIKQSDRKEINIFNIKKEDKQCRFVDLNLN